MKVPRFFSDSSRRQHPSPKLSARVAATAALVFFSCSSFGTPVLRARQQQTTPSPNNVTAVVEEQLLNGLNILILPRPAGEPKFYLQLRINAGAAFDLTGKEGTMALLADALTPEANVRQDIREEMGGRFDVSTTYDSTVIEVEGRNADFERYVEILRGVLLNPPLGAEAVKKMRDARQEILRQSASTPTAIAERAVAARLYGTHPYGRPSGGSPESLARVAHTDVILARDRFLHPNNSVLLIAGDLSTSRTRRALSQLLGSWRRSETTVPATFQQSNSFDRRLLLIDLAGAPSAEIRVAARQAAAGYRESVAAELLALVAQTRWRNLPPGDAATTPLFVRYEERALGGTFTMGASVPTDGAARALETARQTIRSLGSSPITTEELSRAKSELKAQLTKTNSYSTVAARWLSAGQPSKNSSGVSPDNARIADQVTAQDLARAAVRLFPDPNAATVVVGNVAQLKSALERVGQVEVLGEAAAPAAPPASTKSPQSLTPPPSQTPAAPRPSSSPRLSPPSPPPLLTPSGNSARP